MFYDKERSKVSRLKVLAAKLFGEKIVQYESGYRFTYYKYKNDLYLTESRKLKC